VGLREDSIRAHPEFPWLDANDSAGIASYLAERGWLAAGEVVERCERAGEGNMNLTLRIHTSARRFILKQSRPWVEKYPEIEAPWDRSQSELRFYQYVSAIPGVRDRMPRLIAGQAADRVLLLEDLEEARDFTSLYQLGSVDSRTGDSSDAIRDDEIEELAAYLRALHGTTRGTVPEEFANRTMRALNHAHLFVVPLDAENGLALDEFEPGLAKAAERLMANNEYRQAVAETGDRYLRDGPCLVHADYYPGSWLRTAEGVRVIDPEFSFPGDPEVDLGCAVAHLALARQPLETAERLLAAYTTGHAELDPSWLARYAAVEVMRRLIGVAQLPLPTAPFEGRRCRLLERSLHTMLSGQVATLF